jgi:hypothetical protein
MPVRKTESRIPQGLQATDLGEAVVATDGRCALVSFISAPLAVNRENSYVVFVTDPGLAAQVQTFEWTFTEDIGTPIVQTSDFGQMDYTPSAEGYLALRVRLLDSGSTEQANLTLTQQIGPLNAALEEMIVAAADQPGPGSGNNEVLRELVNDHNPYYMQVTLKTPETGTAFQSFVFSKINDGALQRQPDERSSQLDQVADSINTGNTDFISATAEGLGVAGVRLTLVAMMLPPNSIPYTELPSTNAENAVADEQLRETLAGMAEPDRIDLFNLVRFPKANITTCGKLLEALRDKFFAGVDFDDVVTKMSGTMATWIVLNYNQGPQARS